MIQQSIQTSKSSRRISKKIPTVLTSQVKRKVSIKKAFYIQLELFPLSTLNHYEIEEMLANRFREYQPEKIFQCRCGHVLEQPAHYCHECGEWQ